MNLLFLCSKNQWRSPTAETIFKNSGIHIVKSAGTEPSARIKVSEKLILWADIIFVMEKHHRERIEERFPVATSNKKIIILDIPDDYKFMDEELIEMLKLEVEPYL
ncbi:MAG: protein tyrosine phosphatase [Bacteroidota bacterium]|nr:protein tyrosine phosphatase [Bacteroidota bacterium]